MTKLEDLAARSIRSVLVSEVNFRLGGRRLERVGAIRTNNPSRIINIDLPEDSDLGPFGLGIPRALLEHPAVPPVGTILYLNHPVEDGVLTVTKDSEGRVAASLTHPDMECYWSTDFTEACLARYRVPNIYFVRRAPLNWWMGNAHGDVWHSVNIGMVLTELVSMHREGRCPSGINMFWKGDKVLDRIVALAPHFTNALVLDEKIHDAVTEVILRLFRGAAAEHRAYCEYQKLTDAITVLEELLPDSVSL